MLYYKSFFKSMVKACDMLSLTLNRMVFCLEL